MTKWTSRILLMLIVGAAGLLYFSNLNRGHEWGDDFAAYISQARSLIKGNPSAQVAANRFIVENSSFSMGPVAYPWGFAVLLAPVYGIFGHHILALKSVVVVCFLIYLAVVWLGFRRRHSLPGITALVCLFAFNPLFLEFSNQILSDLPYLLFSTLSILLMGAVIVDRKILVTPRWDRIFLGASISWTFFIRTHGLVVLVTLFLTQLALAARRTGAITQPEEVRLESEDRSARHVSGDRWLPFLPYLAFLVLVSIWSLVLPEGGSSYFGYLGDMPWRSMLGNAVYYFMVPSEFFYSLAFPPEFYFAGGLKFIVYGATLPLALNGIYRRRSKDLHALVYMALTLGLLVVYPFTQGIRFIFPLLPFYFSFVITGLEEMCRKGLHGSGSRGWLILRRTICVLPLLMIFITFGKASLGVLEMNQAQKGTLPYGPYTRTSREMFTWITQKTELESTILFFKPRAMRLMTGHRSLMINNSEQLSRGEYLCYYLREDPVAQYVQIPAQEIEALKAAHRLEPVWSNPDFALYRIHNSQ